MSPFSVPLISPALSPKPPVLWPIPFESRRGTQNCGGGSARRSQLSLRIGTDARAVLLRPPHQVTSLVEASEVQALLQALTRCLGKTKTWEDCGQTPTQDPAVRRGEAEPARGLLQA